MTGPSADRPPAVEVRRRGWFEVRWRQFRRAPRPVFLTAYVAIVLVAGALITWLVVPLPTGSGSRRATRTPWSAALGLFAAVPIAYLVLVVLHEIVKPLLP